MSQNPTNATYWKRQANLKDCDLQDANATIAALQSLVRTLGEALHLEGTCLCTKEYRRDDEGNQQLVTDECYTCRAIAAFEAAKKEGVL